MATTPMFEYEYDKIKPKRSSGILGKILAVLLGIIIGILAGIGGMAGLFYALVFKVKIKTSVNTINNFLGTEINYADFINGKYGEKTIADFAGDTIYALDDIAKSKGSLNTLNDLSPLVGELMIGENGTGGLVGFLNEYYLNLEPDEVMDHILVKPSNATADPDVYLMDYIRKKVDDVPLADFLIKMGYPLNDTLLAICCGIEYVEFEKNPDGTIKMLNGHKQLTLGEFLSEDLETAIYRLPIDSIMPINTDDKIMMVLAYGDEFCYTLEKEANGEIRVVMNQVFYTYDKTKKKLFNGRGTEVEASKVKNLNLTEGTCKLIDGDNVEYLKSDDVSGNIVTFYAYSSNEYKDNHKIFYKKTTINDLQSGAVHLVEDMYIKDVLDIEAGDDRMLVSLAYGVKDVDYTIVVEDGVEKIVSINPPRTIGDLRDRGEDLIYEIYLYDVIDTDTDDKLSSYILYGKEGMHYTVIDHDNVEMLQRQVAVAGNKVYNEYGDVYLNQLNADGTFVDKKKLDNDDDDTTYKLGASTGKTLTTVDGTKATLYYVVDEEGNPVKFPYISLGDLKGDSPILENMTKRLTLGDVIPEEEFENRTVLSKLQDTTLENLPDRMETLTVGEVFGDENIFLKSLKDHPLEGLNDSLDTLTVGEIFGDRDEDGNFIYVPDEDGIYILQNGEYVKDKDGNGDYSIKISAITYVPDENGEYVLQDDKYVLAEDGDGDYRAEKTDNPILSAMSSTNINDLDSRANELTVGDVVPNAEDNQILKHLTDTTLENLDDDVKNLTFNQVFENEIWESDGTTLKPTWKYLLDDNVGDADNTIDDYYIISRNPGETGKDINTMLDNMTNNMQVASLELLIEDEIIVLEDSKRENFLKSYFVTDPTMPDVESNRTYLKDMTIVELLDFATSNAKTAP